jgi:hypothetical protein
MDRAQRESIIARALDRCEYCHIPQAALDLLLHVDHVIARQHRGETTPDNLCVACDRCNLKKGPNLASIDPLTGDLVPLFNPRQDDWSQHFSRTSMEIVGRTAIGRATAALLEFNSARRRELRGQLIEEGAIPAIE